MILSVHWQAVLDDGLLQCCQNHLLKLKSPIADKVNNQLTCRQTSRHLESCATELLRRFVAAGDQMDQRRPGNTGSGSQVVDLDDDLDIRGPVTTMPTA